MEWIPLDDHPPFYGQRVLLCDQHGWVTTGIREKYLGYRLTDGEEPTSKITHWMPLPKPPEA